jgi:hypothetical protein
MSYPVALDARERRTVPRELKACFAGVLKVPEGDVLKGAFSKAPC